MKSFRLLRALYALIFLMALIVVFSGWPMAGGQVHMDYVDWEWKVACPLAFAAAASMLARSVVENERAWNAAAIGWLLALMLVVAAMGLLTYRAHLEEVRESEESETYRGAIRWLHPPLRQAQSHATLGRRNLPRRPAYL